MDSVAEFLQSWTFLAIMAGLLCFCVLLIPLGILFASLSARRAARENRDRDD